MKVPEFMLLICLLLSSCTERFDEEQKKQIKELKEFYLKRKKLEAASFLANYESWVISDGLRQNDVSKFKQAKALYTILTDDSISDSLRMYRLHKIYKFNHPEDSNKVLAYDINFSELERYNWLIRQLTLYSQPSTVDCFCFSPISIGVFQSNDNPYEFKVAAFLNHCNEGFSKFDDGSKNITFNNSQGEEIISVKWKLLKSVEPAFDDPQP